MNACKLDTALNIPHSQHNHHPTVNIIIAKGSELYNDDKLLHYINVHILVLASGFTSPCALKRPLIAYN